MPATVPHQNVFHINRDMPDKNKKEGNFLLIKNENLHAVYRDLNATALCLYLYLAGNMDGFNLAISPQTVYNEMGMPISTCKDQVKVLIAKGYLVPKAEGSNVYDFFEVPKGKKKAETTPVF